MVAPSSELLAVSRRWFKANIESSGWALRDFLSDSEYLRLLGSGPDENWHGEDVREAVDAFFQEKPEILRYEETFAEAFEAGDVGWSLFVHNLVFVGAPDTPVEFRDTLIFALEKGTWRIIHRHGSAPVPNEQTIGVHQRPISELAQAARDTMPLLQTEGLASVMFTDIVSSSTLVSALGDQVWSRTIKAHFAVLQQIIESHGGQFVKTLGDGTMSSFASARSALAAARDIQQRLEREEKEPRLSVRIGIHTGDVVQEQADFFGSVVNIAARIADAAGPGQVLVSEVTHALVGTHPELAFDTGVETVLAGQSKTETLYRLKWQGPQAR